MPLRRKNFGGKRLPYMSRRVIIKTSRKFCTLNSEEEGAGTLRQFITFTSIIVG